MKKLFAVLLCFTMIFAATACGTQATSESDTEGTTAAMQEEGGETPAQNDTAAKGDALNIAIITSPSTVDDGSFNENNYEGVLAFIANHPDAKVTPINEPTGDPANAVKTASDIVADYDVIIGCGFQFAGLASVAADNPDVKFILVDTFPMDETGEEIQLDNMYAMIFAEQESGFFAGLGAALESQSKKVAVINGIAYPSNVNYQWGFESGVNYANKKYNTGVEIVELPSYAGTDVTGADVGGNYVGNFNDEATGKVVANALLDKGCDILFVAAGASGNGVFTAVKENAKAKVIGCDVDQFDDGVNGDENIILTSALKVMDMNVTKQLEKIADGSFTGQNELLTAATDSTGYVNAEGRNQFSEDTIDKLEEAYKLIKDGSIVPASNFNGNTPEDFPGMDK